MSEEKKAIVHDDELAAIKDARTRDMLLFTAASEQATVWIVAVSDHQAKLAMVDRVWPMEKRTKRERDSRYLDLLESAVEADKGTSQDDE